MFAKTVCKPGATIVVAPIGLPVTLQYNMNGLIQNVQLGFGDVAEAIPELRTTLIQHRIIPSHISITGGTTYVEGMLYTTRSFYDEGWLPGCLKHSYLEDFKSSPSDYTFLAGNVRSFATNICGYSNIQTWLQMNKFMLLPSMVCAIEFSDEFLSGQLSRNITCPFEYPSIAGIFIFEKSSCRWVPSNLQQHIVSKVERFNSPEGYIQARVCYKDFTQIVNYSDVISYNLQKGMCVLMDKHNHILASYPADKKIRKAISNIVECSVCHNLFRAPSSGVVMCTDDQCRSRMYPQICKMLKLFNLKPMSVTMFNDVMKSGDIITLSDVLSLPKYKDEHIVTDMCTVLEACTPTEICANKQVFRNVSNLCFNSLDTLKYYLKNPIKLVGLPDNNVFAHRFKEWLTDESHRLTILGMLDHPNVTIDNTVIKKFDGPAIFRNKNIYITGTFNHGNHSEISSILSSYSGTVVPAVDNNTHCVLTGSLKENIDGSALAYARQHDIPIFTENEFFAKYEIDSDLAKNLLS